MKAIRLLLILLGSTFLTAMAQEPVYPVVGGPCPAFSLTEVQHFSREQVSLADLKGKWFVLDFWNRYCTVCVNRMPGLDSLSRRFAGRVDILLVGYTGSRYTHRSDNWAMHELSGRLRRELDLSLPMAFDSTTFKQFDIGPCPYIVVVDPKGIVRGVTTHITAGHLEDVLAGHQPAWEKAFNRKGL
jgi:thiol-disulfide isomerase/thioredoxin